MRRRLQYSLTALIIVAFPLLVALRLAGPSPGEPQPLQQQLAPAGASGTLSSISRGCPITGDLTGDANPATVAAALCGP